MRVTARMTVSSMMPFLLVHYAREAHGRLVAGAHSRREPLDALLYTVTAAEAVVNRMLEPLLPEAEWPAVERQGQGRKWTRLSKELSLAPPLALGSPPLADFLKTAEARHGVVHFQHRMNRQHLEAETELGPTGSATLPVATMQAVGPVTPEEALRPDRALFYYPSFETLLRTVLQAYALRDQGAALYFGVALDGKVTEQ